MNASKVCDIQAIALVIMMIMLTAINEQRQTTKAIDRACKKTDEGVRKMTRPTFKDFKEKALSNPAVREEYEASAAAFAVKRQLIALHHQAGLTQEQMAERLGTQKSNISRLEN